MEETGKRTDRKSQGMRSRYQDIKAMREGIVPFDVDDGLEMQQPEEPEDIVKIRDAVTDKTIVSVTEAKQVREAANQLQMEEDLDDIVKIRDAMTDKTIVSVTEAKQVREAANQLQMEEDLDDIVKIRDAMTDKTIVSVDEARSVRDAAGLLEADTIENTAAVPDAEEELPSVQPEKENPAEQEPKKAGLFSRIKKGSKEKTKKEKKEKKEKIEKIQKEEPQVSEEPEPEAVPDFSDDFLDSMIIEQKTPELDFDADDFIDPDLNPDDEDPEEEPEEYYREEPVRPVYSRQPRRESRPRYPDYDPYYDDYEDGYYEYDHRKQNPYKPSKSPLRFIPLVLVIALCVLGFITARTICFDNPVNPSDYSRIKYTVTADTTNESLAQDLQSLGLIDNPLVFRLRCFFYSAKYVEGEYELSPSFSTEKIINILSGYNYGEEN